MNLLGSISKGLIARPLRMIVYGQSGIGKSTFASHWPSPLFIDVEQRTSHLDVSRIEAKSWDDVLGVMKEVLQSEKTPYKTLVFDTLDHLEYLIHDKLCADDGVSSIEEYGKGYGKGYVATVNEWRRFALGCEKLRDKGINIVMLAHAHVKTFKNPVGEDYDKWQLKMHAKSANFLREKCDALGFARFDEIIDGADSKMSKAKVVDTGAPNRLLTFRHSAAWESKAGINLPDEIPLDYKALKESI